MAGYRLAGPARRSIVAILRQSAETFGPQARERYAVLFVQAMTDLAADPGRAGVDEVSALDAALGIYYLKHARAHVGDPAQRVKAPRHALVFTVADDGIVDILGVVHDRMLLGPALTRLVRANRDGSP